MLSTSCRVYTYSAVTTFRVVSVANVPQTVISSQRSVITTWDMARAISATGAGAAVDPNHCVCIWTPPHPPKSHRNMIGVLVQVALWLLHCCGRYVVAKIQREWARQTGQRELLYLYLNEILGTFRPSAKNSVCLHMETGNEVQQFRRCR